jgi:hypothetical protein
MTQIAEAPLANASREEAKAFYAEQLALGNDMSANDLANRYGKTDRWARTIRAEVAAEREAAAGRKAEQRAETQAAKKVPMPGNESAAEAPTEAAPVPPSKTRFTFDSAPETGGEIENTSRFAQNQAQEATTARPGSSGRPHGSIRTEPHRAAPSGPLVGPAADPALETASATGTETVPHLIPSPVLTTQPERGPETRMSGGAAERNEIDAAAKLQYAFYGVAVVFALVGQVWAGVEKIPFPGDMALAMKILIVAPAMAVIELAGVATSHQADLRRRLGEQAYGYRVLSLLAAVIAAGFNLAGHWGQWFPAIGFTGLSVFAYCSWLLQSNARRRDALRASGKLASTPPVYGVMQWVKEPRLTRYARSLAVEYGYGVHESLRMARDERRTDLRRKAIAAAIEKRIRAEQKDEIGATIAATTYDLDRLADEVKARLDYGSAADFIASDLVLEIKDGDR